MALVRTLGPECIPQATQQAATLMVARQCAYRTPRLALLVRLVLSVHGLHVQNLAVVASRPGPALLPEMDPNVRL